MHPLDEEPLSEEEKLAERICGLTGVGINFETCPEDLWWYVSVFLCFEFVDHCLILNGHKPDCDRPDITLTGIGLYRMLGNGDLLALKLEGLRKGVNNFLFYYRELAARRVNKRKSFTSHLEHLLETKKETPYREWFKSLEPVKQKKIKQPSDEAVIIYKLYKMFPDKTQNQLAAILSKYLRREVKQWQVSRNIKKVKIWLNDGNDLPKVKISRKIHNIISIDADIGPRQVKSKPKGSDLHRHEASR